MTTPVQTPAAGSTAKPLKKWLAVSVAANVFLFGALVGVGYIAAKHYKPSSHKSGPALNHMTEGLSPASQARVRDVITEAALDGEADMKAGREHRMAAVGILLSANPDPKSASDEIRRARLAESAAKDKIETAVVGLLIDLPVKERALVAERLVKTPFRARAKALHDVKKAEEAAAKAKGEVAASKP